MDFLRERGASLPRKRACPPLLWLNGCRGPVIGILGEYDALGGLSQAVSAAKEPLREGEPGHGCGHNLLGVYSMLAACAVKETLAAEGKSGTVRYYGCTAEEQLTGKAEMAKLGYFDGTDVSITWHPWDVSTVIHSTMTALFSAEFHFTGRSAHAGTSPEAGHSALDAVELMNVGANYLREHMVDQDRLHYMLLPTGAGAQYRSRRGRVLVLRAFAE